MTEQNGEQQKFFAKKYYKNLLRPIYITGSNVRVIPRMYRNKLNNKSEGKWMDKTLRDREVRFSGTDGSVNGVCPIFRTVGQTGSLCAIRYVRKSDTGYSASPISKVFFDIYAGIPFGTDELFRDPDSKDDDYEDECFLMEDKDRLWEEHAGLVKVDLDEVIKYYELNEPSIKVEFPMKYLSDIDEMNRSINASGFATYTVDKIIERYGEIAKRMNTRIIMADNIVINADSLVTENISIESRTDQYDGKKGMPVRIALDFNSDKVVLSTVEKSIYNQIKYGCDSPNDCKKCGQKKRMKEGTVCSWYIRKNMYKKKNLIARLSFSREEFLSAFTKLIHFAEEPTI